MVAIRLAELAYSRGLLASWLPSSLARALLRDRAVEARLRVPPDAPTPPVGIAQGASIWAGTLRLNGPNRGAAGRSGHGPHKRR
jgi:hypothetical protein